MEEAVMGYEVEVVDLVGFCRVINCTKATVINAELNMCHLLDFMILCVQGCRGKG